MPVAQGEAQADPAHHGRGAVPAADVIEHVERGQVALRVVHGAALPGYTEEMALRSQARLDEGLAHQGLVGQGFQGRATLGNDVDQGARQIEPLQHLGGVVGVYVGDVVHAPATLAEGQKGHVKRPWAEVRTTDAHADHVSEALAGRIHQAAVIELGQEGFQLGQFPARLVHGIRCLWGGVRIGKILEGMASDKVKHLAVLALVTLDAVHHFARHQQAETRHGLGFLRQTVERCQRRLINPLGGIEQIEATGGGPHAPHTLTVQSASRSQVIRLSGEFAQLRIGSGLSEIDGTRHSGHGMSSTNYSSHRRGSDRKVGPPRTQIVYALPGNANFRRGSCERSAPSRITAGGRHRVRPCPRLGWRLTHRNIPLRWCGSEKSTGLGLVRCGYAAICIVQERRRVYDNMNANLWDYTGKPAFEQSWTRVASQARIFRYRFAP